ncbi:MAG: hypothetical protein RLY87_1223, partial [Chloroflexota bacterium]
RTAQRLHPTATVTIQLAQGRLLPSPRLLIQSAVAPHATQTAVRNAPTRTQRNLAPVSRSTTEPASTIPAVPQRLPIMPIAGVLLIAGWIGLRLFAPVTAPVLYSTTDEEAESSESDLPSESRTV